MRRLVFLVVGVFLIVMPARAQYDDYLVRKQHLIDLSGIFGELHHIRRLCEPESEANVWRQRMQTLIELEAPDNATHLKMVESFNLAFRRGKDVSVSCTKQAQRRAKDLAWRGAAIVDSLTLPLEQEETTL